MTKRTTLKLLFIPVLLSGLMFTLTSCDKDDQGGGTVPPTDIFPLKTGNSWKYYSLIEQYDSNGTLIYKGENHHYWDVLKDTLINGTTCFKIQLIDSSFTNAIFRQNVYYANTGTGFYAIAAEEGKNVGLYPKTADPLSHLSPGNMQPGSFGKTGGLFFPDSALFLLKYPMKTGDKWESNEYGNDHSFQRKYLSKETITVPAGKFTCMKVQLNDGQSEDPVQSNPLVLYYYGTKGLTKEVTTSQGNDMAQRVTSMRTTQLLSTNF